MASPVRLDLLLVQRGMAGSRDRAKELIVSGQVLVDGRIWDKAGAQVQPDRDIRLAKGDHPWVSRGALKLLGAIDPWNVSVTGKVCADLGSSTGGFTEVLLEKGATKVFAVDVGRGQLAWKLRQDPRVVVMEGVNARYLEALPETPELIVGDLSFISLELILPAVARISKQNAEAVLLVKPQFEVGRSALGSGGVVKSEADRHAAIERVTALAETNGFQVLGGTDSSVPGAKSGNIEYFLWLKRVR